MRLTKRLQRQRSQWHKGQPMHLFPPCVLYMPKYTPQRILNAQRLLKKNRECSDVIKKDVYEWVY